MERHRHRDGSREAGGGGSKDEFVSRDPRMGDGLDRDKAEGDREDFSDVPGAEGGDDIGGESRLRERKTPGGARRAPPGGRGKRKQG